MGNGEVAAVTHPLGEELGEGERSLPYTLVYVDETLAQHNDARAALRDEAATQWAVVMHRRLAHASTAPLRQALIGERDYEAAKRAWTVVRNCTLCGLRNAKDSRPPPSLERNSPELAPIELWGADFLIRTERERGDFGEKNALVIVDVRTRRLFLRATRDRRSETALGVMREAVGRHGPPRVFILDNAPELKEGVAGAWLRDRGILLQDSPPATSAARGAAEQAIGVVRL